MEDPDASRGGPGEDDPVRRLRKVPVDPVQQSGHDDRGALGESRAVGLDADHRVAGRGRRVIPVRFDQPREEAGIARAPREGQHDAAGGTRRRHHEQIELVAIG